MSRRVGNGSIENETEPNSTTVGLNKNEKMTMFLERVLKFNLISQLG